AVARARAIVTEGTSADGQVGAYEAALADGKDERAALSAAVDWIADAAR
ncbi:carboxylate--amine ligase, partial [Methylobacterium sp. WL18]